MLSYDNVTVYGNAKIDYMWITNLTETTNFINTVLKVFKGSNFIIKPVSDTDADGMVL